MKDRAESGTEGERRGVKARKGMNMRSKHRMMQSTKRKEEKTGEK